MANLRRIGMTYYVRFIIPKDRWDDCEGKREVVRTLQTRDLKEARKRRFHALEAIKAELNDKLIGRGLKSLDANWTPDWQTRALEDNAKISRQPKMMIMRRQTAPTTRLATTGKPIEP